MIGITPVILFLISVIGLNNNNMYTERYVHNNVWHVIPTILITTDGPVYYSIDFVWLKWGVSWVIKDEMKRYD